MTQEIFDKGYKTLMRFLKDIGRYQDFKKITAHNNPKYKKNLYIIFNEEGKGKSWWHFFDYTFFVGQNWKDYNDPGLNALRENWRNFLKENDLTYL